MHTCGSVSAERVEQVEKTKRELELTKIVGCLVNRFGICAVVSVTLRKAFVTNQGQSHL